MYTDEARKHSLGHQHVCRYTWRGLERYKKHTPGHEHVYRYTWRGLERLFDGAADARDRAHTRPGELGNLQLGREHVFDKGSVLVHLCGLEWEMSEWKSQHKVSKCEWRFL